MEPSKIYGEARKVLDTRKVSDTRKEKNTRKISDTRKVSNTRKVLDSRKVSNTRQIIFWTFLIVFVNQIQSLRSGRKAETGEKVQVFKGIK